MTKLASDRDTHLTRAEIAAETLRQFDNNATEPSIRSLAAALRVAPTAIYYHFPSRAAIFQAAVELVWNETAEITIELVPDLDSADPVEVLIAGGLATRRAWLAHHRLARYMAATPESNEFTTAALGLLSSVFERLDLSGAEVATALHNYASFMIGAVLFAADRATANAELALDGGPQARFNPAPPGNGGAGGQFAQAEIEAVMNLSVTDPVRDEALFEVGLRRLIGTFVRAGEG